MATYRSVLREIICVEKANNFAFEQSVKLEMQTHGSKFIFVYEMFFFLNITD